MVCIDEVHMVRQERLAHLLPQSLIRKTLARGMAFAILVEKGCTLDQTFMDLRNKADHLLDLHLIHKEAGESKEDLYWWVADQIDQFEQELAKAQ
jgi:hypothetical protein